MYLYDRLRPKSNPGPRTLAPQIRNRTRSLTKTVDKCGVQEIMEEVYIASLEAGELGVAVHAGASNGQGG
jgi:hypothetical protein